MRLRRLSLLGLGGLGLLLAACRPVVLTAHPAAPRPKAAPARSAWGEAKPAPAGLDVIELALPADDTGTVTKVVAVVADPARTRLRVIGARESTRWLTAAQVAQRERPLASLNGGYFDDRNRPMGWLVCDGQVLNPWRAVHWPAFLIHDGRARIVSQLPARRLGKVDQAVQCGPKLVTGGRPERLKDSPVRARSAVGLDRKGRIVLVATTSGGLRLEAFAAMLARPRERGGIGCLDALNLDGGPSTQLTVGGEVRAPGMYPMPSHLLLVPRR